MLFVSCYVSREHGSFIGSYFMTIIFVVCFSRPMIFNSLSCFDSLAFDASNPPSQVNLLDHQILSNYWIDEISFRTTPQCLIIALHNSGVCLASFFSKQNGLCRPQGRELPSESPRPPSVPKFGLSIVGWAKNNNFWADGRLSVETTASRVMGTVNPESPWVLLT